MTKIIIITTQINDEIMQNKIVQISKLYIIFTFSFRTCCDPKELFIRGNCERGNQVIDKI